MASSPVKAFSVDRLPVRVFASIPELAAAAADDAAAVLREAIAKRGRARAIIATGNSQDQFLGQLVERPGIAWGQVELFHMDEYLGIPADRAIELGTRISL